MAFGDPFAANVDRKMTKGELIQSIRADISGELDAIYGYDAHVQATDDPVAIAVLSDIRMKPSISQAVRLKWLKCLRNSVSRRMKLRLRRSPRLKPLPRLLS